MKFIFTLPPNDDLMSDFSFNRLIRAGYLETTSSSAKVYDVYKIFPSLS